MYLTALLLACVAWVASAKDGCVCQVHRSRRGANWGMNYAGARIDAQEMRIAGLAKSIDALAQKVSKDSGAEYKHTVHELGRRVEHIEGSDCAHDEVSCGKKSGQCISDLLICDGKEDCNSGADESENMCTNGAPAGRSWTGKVNVRDCEVGRYDSMTLLITGTRQNDFFGSRVWLDAVIVTTETHDGVQTHKTWPTDGYFCYGHREIHLNAPKNTVHNIAMTCTDGGEGVADCDLIRNSDGHVCAHAVLVRDSNKH